VIAAEYGAVALPVVVVGGVRDRIAPFAESEVFCRHLPNATLVAVDDGGHALHVTHPEAVATAIELAFEAAAKAGEPAAPPVPIRPSSGPATPLANEAVA